MDWGTIGLYVCCGCLILLYLMQDGLEEVDV